MPLSPSILPRQRGALTFALGCWLFAAVAAVTDAAPAADQEWASYLGDAGRTHFSPLTDINRSNVTQLTPAWTYHAGDARENRSQIQCNPLMIGGVLYGTTPGLKAFALDAATGKELWRFDPAEGGNTGAFGVNRGVTYWAADGDARILYVADHFLYALNARTGRPVPEFGANGRVDIKEGLGRDASRLLVSATSPGIVFKDLLVLGTRVAEGPGPAAPGHVRAYDIRTGRIVWIFHTIPHPGEYGYETWPPEAWQYIGGANAWPGMSLDEGRGLLFVPLGSATFDFWGGNRIGQNLFANCLVALDAATGKRRWHYQLVHHDLTDRDPPAAPTLLTVRRDGRLIDAVAQVTKAGVVFVFNRDTGEPLFPVEERPAAPSDLQGESAWPTQPWPTRPAPFTRQLFTGAEITDLTPEAHRAVLDRFVKIRPQVPFQPPSREGTIIFPGFDGGAEWGGAAVDPRSGVLYVNANEMPWILTMVETRGSGGAAAAGGEGVYRQLCAACHGLNRAGDPARAFPSLQNVGAKFKRPDLLNLLRQGKGVMPAFAFLSPAQMESLAALLLGETPAAVADPAATRAEPAPATEAPLGEPYTHTGYNRWLDPQGYPAVKPPWGTLNAIDLNSGELLWRTPLGEYPELTARGIPRTGTENYGGPVVTAGGLLFIAAATDERLHAFDQATGKLLWEAKLPAGGYATPATYRVNGRQYVVIACGGGKMGTKSGDAYVAFALP